MWIIPKTLSHFVPDTEGLRLALDERAWILEQSAMWRSKPSSKPTWLRRLKKDAWMTQLSTRILKPSLRESFEEKYTASLVDIRANRSVQRESAKEKKTQGTCGRTSESTSEQLVLPGFLPKTSEVTPRWGYGESCPIWKKMVTERSGACLVRRKRARLTSASDASSLRNYPTPAARDYKGTNSEEHVLHKSKGFKGHMNQLPNFIKYGMSNWATPQASDHVEGARTAPASNQKCLGRDLNQMENWPTPRAGNPGSRKPGTGGKILAEEAKKNWGTPRGSMANSPTEKQIKLGAPAKKIEDQVMCEEHAGPPAPEKSNTSGKNHGSWPTPNTPSGGPTKGCPQGMNGGKGHREMMKGVFKETSPKLNPNWVEQLMGLEVGWTQLPTEWIDSDS
jgi:hypothetical protein